MAKKSIDFDSIASGLFSRTEQYADRVRQHYATAVDELLKLAATATPNGSAAFSFADNTRLSNKANEILRGLYSAVYNEIQNGVKAEWGYANVSCDTLIESLFGKGLNEDNHFARWFSRNEEAMDAFLKRKNAPGGLNLSKTIWKYTGDFRTEMETALSVSLGQGDSAATVSRKVRQYLEHPDDMFRRFRVKIGDELKWNPDGTPVIDPVTGKQVSEPVYGRRWKKKVIDPATGQVTWENFNPKDYHTGRGVYRSSYKNAMRLTRTETNMAYRTSEQERWQQLDFVVGYEVKCSANHPDYDICDVLKGRYPKTFTFRGWHPQCRCFCVPILSTQEEFLNQQQAILDGDENPPAGSVNEVTRLPKNFTDWVDENEERLEEAADKGTLPYFITDNEKKKFDSDPLPIPQSPDMFNPNNPKHQTKMTTAQNVLKVAAEYPEVDVADLTAYVDAGGSVSTLWAETQAVAQKILAVKQDEQALSALLPNVHEWKKQFTSSELHSVFSAVESKLAMITSTDLAKFKSDLLFEAKWVEDKKKYSTWEVAKAAYEKKAAELEVQLHWQNVRDVLAEAKTFKTKSQPYLDLITKLEGEIAAGDLAAADLTVADMKQKRDQLKKAAARRSAASLGDAKMEAYCDAHRTFDSDIVDQASFEVLQKRGIKDCRRHWLAASDDARRWLAKYTDGDYYWINSSCWQDFTGCEEGKHISSLLDKCKISKDTVLRRGCDRDEVRSIFGDTFADTMADAIRTGDFSKLNAMMGHKGINEGFISTSFDMEGGFGGSVNFVFFAPRGTEAIYAKPISMCQDHGGKDWDGKTARKHFSQGSENEFVVNRGYTYRFVKAEAGDRFGHGSSITIYVELITRKNRRVK